MTQTSAVRPVKYVAEIKDALEVSLVATANLAFWQERLRAENLVPFAGHGQAEVLISSVRSRFLAVPFQELVVTITVSHDPQGQTRDGYYLADAFNSSRLFAWIERTAFQTPYRHADVRLSREPQAGILLQDRDGPLFEVSRASSNAPTIVDEPWEGTIFLPTKAGGKHHRFFGRFRGESEVSLFESNDTFRIPGADRQSILRDLVDSNVIPKEWRIRPQATHARSKTYLRN